MKKAYIYIILLSAVVLGFNSCLKPQEPTEPAKLEVRVKLPEWYKPETNLEGRNVILTSRGVKFTAKTNADGVAVFEGVIPAIFDIAFEATRFTNEEYLEITEDNRQDNSGKSVQITGVKNGQRVFGDTTIELDLTQSVIPSWLISKMYTLGRKDLDNKNYNNDSYIEIFNNSDETLYADGLYVARTDTESANLQFTVKYRLDNSLNTDSLFLYQIVKVPGSGTDHPVKAGESFYFTTSATDQTAKNGFDLTNADFESKGKLNTPNNPNVPEIEFYYGFLSSSIYMIMNRVNFGCVIFQPDDDNLILDWGRSPLNPTRPASGYCKAVPRSFIIDGVEILAYKATGEVKYDINAKRLYPAIDAGYVYAETDKANVFCRKVEKRENGRVYLQDTNNSVEDFVTIQNSAPKDYEYQF